MLTTAFLNTLNPGTITGELTVVLATRPLMQFMQQVRHKSRTFGVHYIDIRPPVLRVRMDYLYRRKAINLSASRLLPCCYTSYHRILIQRLHRHRTLCNRYRPHRNRHPSICRNQIYRNTVMVLLWSPYHCTPKK